MDYEKGGRTVIITNLEFIAEVAGVSITIFDHPECTYVVVHNDNQNVVDNINSGKARNVFSPDEFSLK